MSARAKAAAAEAGLRHRPRVYTIPAGVPFLDALAGGILDDMAGDRIALARATVLLPNRRACRNLRDAFLRRSDGEPMLLPRLQPIGDVDDDEFVLSGGSGDGAELPPPIGTVERRLLLTELILQRPDVAAHPGVAARLAEALAGLLDSAQIEDASLDRLDRLVPADLAEHWQTTLEFLRIVREHWPKILAERGQMDPVAHRVSLIRAAARRWAAQPPADPVYAAGSTGSIPATAELLHVVARLPQGKLVLPGLDLSSDDGVWEEIGRDPTHPQYGLHVLLAAMAVKRGEVRAWRDADAAPTARVQLLADALRPAATTDSWRHLPPAPDAAFAGLHRIEAPTAHEEAGAIALIMREALETPGRTAALITPDRTLARRVVAELARWNVPVDDSAGVPLAGTPPGVFFRLVAAVVAEGAAPVPLLSLLKHPLAHAGGTRGALLRKVRYLERRVLRGPRPAPGFKGLMQAVAESRYRDDLLGWLEPITLAAAPLERLMAGSAVRPSALAAAHTELAQWLASPTGHADDTVLWHGDAGEKLAAFVAELHAAARALRGIDGAAWPGLLDSLMSGEAVRPRYGRHPRLKIWGLLEARLQQADVLILGGLNEGTWPAEPQEDPWLSRPMRKELGLSPPERRVGMSAHDFAQAAAAPCVYLTRARKVDGAPTVPSRWLLRLEAMLERHEGWARTRAHGYIDWHRRLDGPAAAAPMPAPRPVPPVRIRPRALSVTQVEAWIRDPYAVFARHVLDLRPLEDIDADPGALDRGQMIHRALDAFVRAFPDALPGDAVDRLMACGEEAFRAYMDRPAVRTFWWPRFVRAAEWFVEEERRRRAAGVRPLATEIEGALALAAPGDEFRLTAKADRIDLRPDGALAILDYKTGPPPSGKQVGSGISPQLSLEAAIAIAGGFAELGPRPVAELAYVRLSGGVPAGQYVEIRPKDEDGAIPPDRLAAEALQGLARRVRAFALPEVGYLSRPRAQWLRHAGDYDHLARVKEWLGRGDP